jgi:RNA polymerase sigma factor (sigma-70 family)
MEKLPSIPIQESKQKDDFKFQQDIPKKTHPDQKYINALLNNDAAVLNELYEKFSSKIKWMVLRNNGTETDAADIFQDALLSIYNKAKKQDFVLTCPLDAFLYHICKNRWISEIEKRKLHKQRFVDLARIENGNTESYRLAEGCLLQQDRKKLLETALRKLSSGNRKLLELCWSGKSMEEVASILHVSYSYARKKKSQCIAKLIRFVKETPEFNSLKG